MKKQRRKVVLFLDSTRKWLHKHPAIVAIFSLFLYLALFQTQFLRSGDIWAEAYMEYLPKALDKDWWAVIMPSWEGYVTLLPSFFTKLFVDLQAPLGAIDAYFRAITILFVVGCLIITFRAARGLIPSLWQRLVLILALILPLSHISAFSFINVWYIGFVPLAVLCLNPKRLSVLQQILYVLFAAVVAFTKPSVILAPFIIYRAVKTKEYISNIIVLAAVATQTYLLFFAGQNGARQLASDALQIIQGLYVGAGVEVLKLLHIAPNDILILLANLSLVAVLSLLVWRRGWLIAGLLAFGFAFSVYAHVLAPGVDVPRAAHAGYLFEDIYKIQRELLIYEFLIISLGLLLPDAWCFATSFKKNPARFAAIASLIILTLLFGASVYRPIDTRSSALMVNIDPFRSSLNLRQPTCAPVAPLPSWSPGTSWHLSLKGGCTVNNTGLQFAFGSFMTPLDRGGMSLTVQGMDDQHSLLAVMVPVRITGQSDFYLQDVKSGAVFATRNLRTPSGEQFIAFNTASLPPALEYKFVLNSSAPALAGNFSRSQTPAHYPYFMALPKSAPRL